MHAEQQELRKKLATGEWDDELERSVDAAVKEFADDFGYDLDEEGLPLEEPETGDEERHRREVESQPDSRAGAEDGEVSGAEEPAEEPAAV
jgi:F-type H+-transporting ATPase subunit alpha